MYIYIYACISSLTPHPSFHDRLPPLVAYASPSNPYCMYIYIYIYIYVYVYLDR